jgi:hypothetical protein
MEQITIQGTPVIDIYESFDGSYWFVTEKAWRQNSIIRGRVYRNDQIFFGYVRLSSCPECAEWGYFSEAELKRLGPRVWKVHRQDWSVCPGVEVRELADGRSKSDADSCGVGRRSHSQNQEGGNEDEAAGI